MKRDNDQRKFGNTKRVIIMNNKRLLLQFNEVISYIRNARNLVLAMANKEFYAILEARKNE